MAHMSPWAIVKTVCCNVTRSAAESIEVRGHRDAAGELAAGSRPAARPRDSWRSSEYGQEWCRWLPAVGRQQSPAQAKSHAPDAADGTAKRVRVIPGWARGIAPCTRLGVLEASSHFGLSHGRGQQRTTFRSKEQCGGDERTAYSRQRQQEPEHQHHVWNDLKVWKRLGSTAHSPSQAGGV